MHIAKRNSIALLITVYFILVITISIGAGLKYINSSKKSLTQEHFFLQTSVILDDIMGILKNSKELSTIDSTEKLYTFLSMSSFLPLKIDDLDISISLKSARDKLSTEIIKSGDKMQLLKNFLLSRNINEEFAYMMLDSVSGIKNDMTYNTDIFNENPNLFRDNLSSYEHFDKIKTIYMNKYRDSTIASVKLDELFYPFNKTVDIDLNYAKPVVWEFLIDCDAQRAQQLSQNGGLYTSLDDLGLSESEKTLLNRFNFSFYEPILNVVVEINQNKNFAHIEFEYDMVKKKGSNFVYEI
jgi:hypothetical protein